MKQVVQNLRNGQIKVEDVPTPIVGPNAVLIQTRRTLISAGTERMLVEFGKASLLAKAKSQPDKVKQVLDKVKTDGILPTLEAVFRRLDDPLPLGYCNSGVVLEVGQGVIEFKPGDRVASNGPHAEIVCLPKNLCAKIPDVVSDDQATFTALSSVGLQGIRLLCPTLGEKFIVYGLGLIGLLSVQLLCANGCRVMGLDINADRVERAKRYGALAVNIVSGEDPLSAVSAWTEGRGADGVLITASAKNDEIVHQSAQMSRKRGRIVLIGVVEMNLQRSDFYEKELTFQVSCSYGPGRYDENYEVRGQDYPFGFVRWTEQRNFQTILALMQSGQLLVDDLITHRFPIDQAPAAYEKLTHDQEALGILLEYPQKADRSTKVNILPIRNIEAAGKTMVGIIGAGNFSKMTLVPNLVKTNTHISYIADLNGINATHLAKKYGISQAISDYKEILQDPSVNTIFIAVGHDLHAKLVCESLQAGKHVLVEKPLCLNEEELKQIIKVYNSELRARNHELLLMVGFNRRFSPHSMKMKNLLIERSEPLAMNMTINAGVIPPGHWVHDPILGGGRIIGEACHFIDLMVYLTNSKVRSVSAAMFSGVPVQEDKMSIVLGFEDGSVGTVNYFANGSKAYPKESLDVFSEGRVIRMVNFQRTEGYGFRGFSKFKTLRQDKGHRAELTAFIDRVIKGGQPLIPLGQLINVTRASFAAMTSARETRTVLLTKDYSSLTKQQ
jgi:predicted dehydrogenase/threonine dehydrogenase-like Zn-dependent dehydrogenase